MTVKRYETKAPCCYCHGGGCGDCSGPDEHPDGELVLYDDYAALLPLARFGREVLTAARCDSDMNCLDNDLVQTIAENHGLLYSPPRCSDSDDKQCRCEAHETPAARVLDEEATK